MEDTTIEDVLKTVEALYANKDFDGALKILKENQKTLPQGIWNYNMGTLYGKQGEYALARFHLLKANLEGFSGKELILNKSIAEQNLNIKSYEEAISTNDYLYKGALFASEGLLTTFSFIFVVIGLAVLTKTKNLKRSLVYFFPVLLLIGLNIWIDSWPKQVVIESQVIKDGPSGLFNNRGEIPKGVMLITKKKENWLYIEYPSRFSGWIKETGLEELK